MYSKSVFGKFGIPSCLFIKCAVVSVVNGTEQSFPSGRFSNAAKWYTLFPSNVSFLRKTKFVLFHLAENSHRFFQANEERYIDQYTSGNFGWKANGLKIFRVKKIEDH